MNRKMLKALSIVIAFAILYPISAASQTSSLPKITVLESDITVTGSSTQTSIDLDTALWALDGRVNRIVELGPPPPELALMAAYVVEPDQARLEKDVDRTQAFPGDTAQYTITLINDAPLTTTFVLSDSIPENASYVEGSATGGLVYYPAQNVLTGTITLDPPKMSIVPDSLYGYLSLPDIDVDPPFVPQPCPNNNCDDAVIALSGFDFDLKFIRYQSRSPRSRRA